VTKTRARAMRAVLLRPTRRLALYPTNEHDHDKIWHGKSGDLAFEASSKSAASSAVTCTAYSFAEIFFNM
jgi:hypothetical protein